MIQVKSRTVLWYYVFVGFAVNYMIRINVNIAIVDMVLEPKALKSKKISNECLVNATSDLSPIKIGPDLNTGGSNLTTVPNILENSFSQSVSFIGLQCALYKQWLCVANIILTKYF